MQDSRIVLRGGGGGSAGALALQTKVISKGSEVP